MNEAAKEARRKYYRTYRAENGERLRAYYRKWNAENKDRVNQYKERYWEKKAAELAAGDD